MPEWRVKIKKNNMIDFSGRYGQWGMVAGSAEGIGAAFCEELAKIGLNVILVDMNRDGMEALARKIENNYHIKTKTIKADLGQKDAADQCLNIMKELGCRLLIYNAAYSRVKPFLAAGLEEMDQYIDVNARTPLRLVYLFSQQMKRSGTKGGIILMSSLAGLWGAGLVATYSGTKAFNLLLAEALSFELKPYGIDVSACVAGATATPGYLGTDPEYGLIRPTVMKPEKVASTALKKLGKRMLIIPGLSNRLTYFFLTRILPRSFSAKLVNRTMQKTFRQKNILND